MLSRRIMSSVVPNKNINYIYNNVCVDNDVETAILEGKKRPFEVNGRVGVEGGWGGAFNLV